MEEQGESPSPQKALQAIKPEYKIGFALVGLFVMAVVRADLLKRAEISSWAEISGWILLVIGFAFARDLDRRFETLITRLNRRGILVFKKGGLELFLAAWRRRAGEGELAGAIIFPVLVAVGYWLGYREIETGSHFGLKMTLEIIGSIFIGGYSGRMLVYGRLGRRLRKEDVEIRVIAGHPDEAGGLRIVGDFYLFQALLVFLPAAFFAFWFIMAPIWKSLPIDQSLSEQSELFLRWQWIFGWGFLGLMVAEIAAFLVPMLDFHRIMTRRVERNQAKIDQLWGEVTMLKSSIGAEADPEKQETIRSDIEALEKKIGAGEAGPRWPFNAGIRRRLAWGNLLLFLAPVVANQETVRKALAGTLAQFFGIGGG